MKKRVLSTILAATMIVSLTACGKTTSNELLNYKQGTIKETVKGNNGDIVIEVKFSDTAISAIDVVEHAETAGLGDKAMETLISQILEKQTTDIDTVTGATVTSKALLEAVSNAMKKAAGEETEVVEVFIPGTYTATVTGHNADLTAKVTVTEDKIESIEIEHEESNGIGTSAIEILTNEIIENQSLNVDAIAGATVTSNAFIGAVTECIEQTGISKSVLLNREIEVGEKSDKAIEMTADVVVVGAGGAGFAAATEVVENGGTVIMLEKNEYVGGNTARAGGTLNAPDPDRQSKINVEDSVDLFFKNTMEAGDNKSLPELVEVLTSNALDARQWLSAHGTEWTEKVYQTIGGLWPRSMDEKNKVAYNGFIAPLMEIVTEHDGKIIVNCKAEELLQDEQGNVVGVRAVDTKNGQEYIVNANNGVILATGGYSASNEMIEKYNGLSNLPTSNAPTSTGDGINLALGVGADLEGMEYIQIHPHGNPTTGGLQSHFAGVIKNSIYVNQEGNRFVAESERRDVISNATVQQTGQVMYSIFDSNGGFYTGVNELAELETLKAKGYIYEANSLEELAEQVGIDAEGLIATVERYNEMVRNGKDEDFNKDEVELEILTAPFYCTPLSPTAHHTMGGVAINTDTEVLDTEGNVINGLYAAGEVTGGVHGSNRIGGNAMTDIVVFGRIAGQRAMGITE